MQALDRKLDITTRYGGRFVQSIDGVEGSVTSRHDWFYFVDGDRGRPKRQPRRSCSRRRRVVGLPLVARQARCSVPVVVGAYPQPFLGGTTSVTAVGVAPKVARTIAAQVHGTVAAKKPTRNYIVISRSYPPDHVAHQALPGRRAARARRRGRAAARRRSDGARAPLRGRAVSAAPAAALLAALAVAALLVDRRPGSVALICAVLLVAALRAPAQRRWPYLVGTLTSAALGRRC